MTIYLLGFYGRDNWVVVARRWVAFRLVDQGDQQGQYSSLVLHVKVSEWYEASRMMAFVYANGWLRMGRAFRKRFARRLIDTSIEVMVLQNSFDHRSTPCVLCIRRWFASRKLHKCYVSKVRKKAIEPALLSRQCFRCHHRSALKETSRSLAFFKSHERTHFDWSLRIRRRQSTSVDFVI